MYVDSIRNQLEKDIVQLTQDSCSIGYSDEDKDENFYKCSDFNIQSVITILNSSNINKIIISSPFNKEMSTLQDKESFLKLIRSINNRQIIIIGPTPEAPFNVGECIFKKNYLNNNRSCNFNISNSNPVLQSQQNTTSNSTSVKEQLNENKQNKDNATASKVEPKEKLSEREWMAKHNESK
jgi:RNase H-fold protein (predicted Holliday junction resolvase)